MLLRLPDAKPRPATALLGFIGGLAGSLAVLLAIGESYLRWFPPSYLHQYLEDDSPLTGGLKAHDDFRVTHASWDDLRASYADRLRPFLPFDAPSDVRPLWAFFGNSFVQAPSMLADTVAQRCPDIRVFHLARNEPLPLRFAQIEMLLEQGLRPDRIFMNLMTVDMVHIGEQPLRTQRVSRGGALIFEPTHPPAPFDSLTRGSRLAFAAWARAGGHVGNPHFKRNRLYREVDAALLSDLRQLFAGLARVRDRFATPVTVLLIPVRRQAAGEAGYGFQDAVAPMLRELGFDVLDTREAFADRPDLDALYLPDLHFNDRGNAVLLDAVLQHLNQTATHADVDRSQ